MTKSTVFSTPKIIVYLLLVCAALMLSVWAFYWRAQSTQPTTTILANEAGTLFSMPRNIKPFVLTAQDNQPFTEKNFRGSWTLLFFGFTHCSKVCPTTFTMLNDVYEPLRKNYPNLKVVLISLDPERDSTATLAKYTHSFNPAFLGASGTTDELRKLQSQLGIFSAREPAAATSSPMPAQAHKNRMNMSYQIQHTSSILLINPEGKWAGLFKYGLSPAQFTEAFNQAMNVAGKA